MPQNSPINLLGTARIIMILHNSFLPSHPSSAGRLFPGLPINLPTHSPILFPYTSPPPQFLQHKKMSSAVAATVVDNNKLPSHRKTDRKFLEHIIPRCSFTKRLDLGAQHLTIRRYRCSSCGICSGLLNRDFNRSIRLLKVSIGLHGDFRHGPTMTQ